MINLRNARQYIEHFLKIRTKSGKLVPFVLNPPQERLYNTIRDRFNAHKPVRVIILKARQMGFSTLSEALIFWATATQQNVDSMIIAHKDESTANLFAMSKLYYDELPDVIKPMRRASNAQELVFDRPAQSKVKSDGLRSRIRCATAGGKGQGRSYTLRNVHMSEFAFWPGDKRQTFTGIMSAVPREAGTMVIVESTANGFDEFKELWDAAVEAQRSGDEDGFIPVFFAWWEMPSYRTPTPSGFELTPEEAEIKAAFGLDDEQIYWRRRTIKDECGGDINLFKQEYPATPDEAFISTGTPVFDAESIIRRRAAVQRLTPKRGRFRYDYDGLKITSPRWEDDPRGEITIYNEPEAGKPYVIGGDTAGTGSDYFIGQVLDNTNGKQVAVLRHQTDETFYTRQMYCLGMYYNTALIGIETNYSTYPVMELQRLNYPRQYVRQSLDSYTGKMQQSFGFVTSPHTRPTIIDNLKAVVRADISLIQDFDTLGEMLVFVYDERHRPEAMQGKHDDLVMALAIAHEIRTQQSSTVAVEVEGAAEWTDSMKEDYYRATPDEQAYLIKAWGYPKGGL